VCGVSRDETELILIRLVGGGYAEREEKRRLFFTITEYRISERGREEMEKAREKLKSRVEKLREVAERRNEEEMRQVLEEQGGWLPAILMMGLIDGILMTEILRLMQSADATTSYLPMYGDMWGWEEEEQDMEDNDYGEA